MRKNILILLSSFMVTILALTSCYEDKGNYSYNKITHVQDMEGINTQYNVTQGAVELAIIPIIKTDTNGDPFVESDYSYEWRVLHKDSDGVPYTVIGREKNLIINADVNSEMQTLPIPARTALYKVYLHITNITNGESKGVTWDSQTFSLRLDEAGKYNQGFLVLTKEADFNEGDVQEGTRLGFYYHNETTKHWVRREVDLQSVKTESGVGLLKRPVGIFNFPDSNSPVLDTKLDRYGLMITGRDGAYRFLPSDMSYKPAYNFANVFMNMPDDCVITHVASSKGAGTILFTEEGNVYAYLTGGSTVPPNYNMPFNKVLETIDSEVVETVYKFTPRTSVSLGAASVFFGTYYDEIGKRFYSLAGTGGAKPKPLARSDESTATFPFDLSGTTMYVEAMVGPYIANDDAYFMCAIVKDTDNPDFCEVWDFNGRSGLQTTRRDLANQPGITEAKIFQKLLSAAPYILFYATSNKIYAYRKLSTDPAPIVNEVYTAPAGYEIKDIASHKALVYPFWANRLVIRLQPPTGPGWKIDLYDVDDPETGTLKVVKDNATPAQVVTFEGTSELIDFAFKPF